MYKVPTVLGSLPSGGSGVGSSALTLRLPPADVEEGEFGYKDNFRSPTLPSRPTKPSKPSTHKAGTHIESSEP